MNQYYRPEKVLVVRAVFSRQKLHPALGNKQEQEKEGNVKREVSSIAQ